MNIINNLKRDIFTDELIKIEFALGMEHKNNILLAEELTEKSRI